ncbi:hypothetical protein D3C85_371140 [compost metagenome]
MARRHARGVAEPGGRPPGEAHPGGGVPLPDRHHHPPGAGQPADRVPRLLAAGQGPRPVLPGAQAHAGRGRQPAARGDRPDRQRRLLRRVLQPDRRHRPGPADARTDPRRRGDPRPPAARRRRAQGHAAGRAHRARVSRVRQCAADQPGDCPAGGVRRHRRQQPPAAGGTHGDRRPAPASAPGRRPVRSRAAGRGAGAHRRASAQARRHRHHPPRLRGPAQLPGALARAGCAAARRGHGQGRKRPGTGRAARRLPRRRAPAPAAGHGAGRADQPGRRHQRGGQPVPGQVPDSGGRGGGGQHAGHRPARRLDRRHRRTADPGHHLPGDDADGHRPRPHHPGRADHRPGAAGRRRHHRGGNDAGEDGRRLGPRARRRPCLDGHRRAHALRHPGDGGGLLSHRLRPLGGRRVRRQHLLGAGHRAAGVLAGRRGVRTLAGRQDAAGLSQGNRPRPRRGLPHPAVPAPAQRRDLVRDPAQDGGRRDRGVTGAVHRRHGPAGAEAVLPQFGPPGSAGRRLPSTGQQRRRHGCYGQEARGHSRPAA